MQKAVALNYAYIYVCIWAAIFSYLLSHQIFIEHLIQNDTDLGPLSLKNIFQIVMQMQMAVALNYVYICVFPMCRYEQQYIHIYRAIKYLHHLIHS
jgi:hypothetical protein